MGMLVSFGPFVHQSVASSLSLVLSSSRLVAPRLPWLSPTRPLPYVQEIESEGREKHQNKNSQIPMPYPSARPAGRPSK